MSLRRVLEEPKNAVQLSDLNQVPWSTRSTLRRACTGADTPARCLQALTEDELRRVLTEPKNALVKQKHFEQGLHKVELHITQEALHAVAAIAVQKGTGARGLGALLEKLLMAVKFEVRFQV